jgi:hypothetical protein
VEFDNNRVKEMVLKQKEEMRVKEEANANEVIKSNRIK